MGNQFGGEEPGEGWTVVDRAVVAEGWLARLRAVDREAREAYQALLRSPGWQWCDRVSQRPEILGREGGLWDAPRRVDGSHADGLDQLNAAVQHLTALADWADKLAGALRAEAKRQGQVHQRLAAAARRYQQWHRVMVQRPGVEVRVFVAPVDKELEDDPS